MQVQRWTKKIKADTIFYQLLQAVPIMVFGIIDQPPSGVEDYKFGSPEIKEFSFRFDGVFLPQANDLNKLIYFVEVQYQKRENFYWDLFGKVFLYLKQYRPEQCWRVVAIFASRKLEPAMPKQYEEMFNNGILLRVYLDELVETSNQSIGIGMLKLVVSTPENTGEKARGLIEQTRLSLPSGSFQGKIIELIDKILIYKFPQLSKQELDAMFGVDDLKQTQYFQDVANEAEKKGVLKAAREDILEVLKARFIRVPSEVEQILNGIEERSILKELLKRAVTTKDLEEFEYLVKRMSGSLL